MLEKLARFGKLLAKGRKLREENNYEALLVAHEYRHDALSQSFTSLSDSMEKAAYFAMKVACEWLGRALNGGLVKLVKINNSEAQAFFSAHTRRRIQEPIKQWYPLQIVEKVSLVLVPVIAEQSLAYELADHVQIPSAHWPRPIYGAYLKLSLGQLSTPHMGLFPDALAGSRVTTSTGVYGRRAPVDRTVANGRAGGVSTRRRKPGLRPDQTFHSGRPYRESGKGELHELGWRRPALTLAGRVCTFAVNRRR